MALARPPKITTEHATSIGWFRGFASIFAFVLACQAFWILAAEFSRPRLVGPGESAADLATNRSAVHRAAQLGVVRGDLWADDALTYSNVLHRNERDKAADDVTAIQEARDVAERALAFAPHDARIWLVLAGLNSKLDRLNGKASAALRMSYYTGPNEVALIPPRVLLSLTLPVISDKDFQLLVAHDLRTIVTRRPDLKPAISNAYQYASPEGQQFIRDTLKDLDPNLLSSLPEKRRGD
jgi:hypothetical protein